jgi:hypothetical protein
MTGTALSDAPQPSPPAAPLLSPRIRHISSAALLAAYAAVIFALTARHVLWGDEVQGWLRALSLSPFKDFLVIPGGEGHPPLWYWLLRLLSLSMNLDQAVWLSPLLACIAGGLVAWLGRDRPLLVFAALFSAPLMWWPEIFRPYELGGLFLLAAVPCLRRQDFLDCGVFLSLACFTHFYCFFALPLFLGEEFLRHRTVRILKIIAAPCALAFALIFLSAQGNDAGALKGLHDPARFVKYAVSGFSLYRLQAGDSLLWAGVTVLLPLSALPLVFGRNAYAALVAVCLLALNLFFALVYSRTSAHTFMLPFLVILGALIRLPEVNAWALAAVLLLSDVSGLGMARDDMTKKLSNSETAYAWIQKAGLGNLKILSLDDNLLQPAAWRHGFAYYSLATARKTTGLTEYTNRNNTLEQYTEAYKAAGSPRDFLLVASHAWHGRNDSLDPLSADQTCAGLKWACRKIHSDDGAIFENADIYRVQAPAKGMAP